MRVNVNDIRFYVHHTCKTLFTSTQFIEREEKNSQNFHPLRQILNCLTRTKKNEKEHISWDNRQNRFIYFICRSQGSMLLLPPSYHQKQSKSVLELGNILCACLTWII